MKATKKGLIEEAQLKVEPELLAVLGRIEKARPTDGSKDAHRVPKVLSDAMRYALTSPGKRLRPALVLGGARAVGGKTNQVLDAACAVEMVHAYSLIHDDLPALDDAALRRGQPSVHRAYGEANALLTGDALLTEALGLIADPEPKKRTRPSPRRRLEASFLLIRAAGAGGMVGGQVDDVAADGKTLDRPALVSVHRRKTGRLIRAAVMIGGILGGGSPKAIERLGVYGAEIGLAFQWVDDLLDQDGLVALLGKKAAEAEAEACTERALAALRPFGRRGQALAELAERMVARRS